MAESSAEPNLDDVLHDRFALQRFRPGQREVIDEVLRGRDVLCVMPTGGGKSLCYQLPAILLPGVTLVISPLIALMKDQVDVLQSRGLRATLINSTLDLAEQNARLAEVERGQFDMVYVAPERFRSGRFVETMQRIRPSLLAVDEAHCISEWGHDFRPDYARIGAARKAIGMPPCIALTATATDLVRRDIADQLNLIDPAQFVTGFDRPNLTYHAREARKDAEKLASVVEILERNPGPAIIYASSRKRCEEVGAHLSRTLRRQGVVYHAGLSREDRASAQDQFMTGDAEFVVATNAFGMGVDKSNIRSVIHFNMPGTLEAYYQEAGRAGRDGEHAECVLLHAPGDVYLQEMFIENEYPPSDAVFRVYDFLRTLDADPIELTQAEIRESLKIDLNETAIGTSLRILESASALERFRPRENMAIIRIRREPDEPAIDQRIGANAHVQLIVARALEGLVNRRFGESIYFQPDELATTLGLDRLALIRAIRALGKDGPVDYVPPFRGNALRILDKSRRARDLDIDFSSMNKRKNQEYGKLERMVQYTRTPSCRREYILTYFGDTHASSCGHCDNCQATAGTSARRVQAREIDTPAGREVIQKILSGVARSKGNFGKIAVSQMLLGSSSEKIEKSGLTRLSTYGILARSGFLQSDLIKILDALIAAGSIETTDVERFRPVVKLSDRGWNWLRDPESQTLSLALDPAVMEKICLGGLEKIASRDDPRPSDHTSALNSDPGDEAAAWTGDDDPLAARLRAMRLEWSRDAGVKAYHIFTNKVLEELSRSRPNSPQALAAIKGIGPATMEKYGTRILEVVRDFPDDQESAEALEDEPPREISQVPPPPAPSKPQALTTGSYVATEEWSIRLIDRGFTVSEIAAIRGLEIGAVVRHLLWMARRGSQVPASSFLNPDTVAGWSQWMATHGAEQPPDYPDASTFWELFVSISNCEHA